MAPRGAGHDAAKTARQPLAARLIHKLLRQILPGGKGRPHWQDPPNATNLCQGPPHADRSSAGWILFPGKEKNGSGVGIVRLGTGPARNHLWQDPPNAANLCQGPPHADRPGAGRILFPGKEKNGSGVGIVRLGTGPARNHLWQDPPNAANLCQGPPHADRSGAGWILFPGKEKNGSGAGIVRLGTGPVRNRFLTPPGGKRRPRHAIGKGPPPKPAEPCSNGPGRRDR